MLKPQFTLTGTLDRLLSADSLSRWVPQDQDEKWMTDALAAAMSAVGHASPNPAVGCVLVSKHGGLIATGATEPFGGAHAEAVALRRAAGHADLSGATAYVTLEPCNHTGKQPPCTSALIKAGIATVVYGTKDINPGVAGNGEQALRQQGVAVRQSSLSPECDAWHRPFLTMSQTGKPYVALKWAQTLDGHLSDDRNLSQWITGTVARTYAHWLRSYYDDILVGAGTAVSDEPQLTNRLAAMRPHQPQKLIFDPRNRLAACQPTPRLEQTLTDSIVLVDQPSPATWYNSSAQQVVSLDGKGFQGLLLFLESRGQRSIMVEGGPTLLNMFLKEQYYYSVHAFVAPLLVGGGNGKIAHKINSEGLLADAQKWTVVQSLSLGQDTLIEAIRKLSTS